MFRTRQAWFLVPGCFPKQPGKVSCSFPFPPPFFCLLILTIYIGSLAATRSSRGGQRSAALGGSSFRSLAACAAARRAVYGVPHLASVVFGPWLLCKAAREGLPFLSLPLFFFYLLILTIYLGCLAATQSSQGGLWSAALRRGFRSLAAHRAARRVVYGVPRSAGMVFGPWLLCKAARKGFLFRSLPPSFLLFIYTNYLLRLPGCYVKQPGGSTVCHARARFLVPGCSRGS